jgi:hypothetical protein
VLASDQVIGSDMRAPMPPRAASLGYMFQGVNQRSLWAVYDGSTVGRERRGLRNTRPSAKGWLLFPLGDQGREGLQLLLRVLLRKSPTAFYLLALSAFAAGQCLEHSDFSDAPFRLLHRPQQVEKRSTNG